ncbi:nitric oxide reductase activation protein NorD [Rhodospirillum centenum]|uniref:Rubisco activation protein CbbO, putative n=1 Tax=Rhodospirillum centenum (strain ATCC 51521 / SW) TaxID=414684 RepID=B6IQF5_RHOCS|nr:VWA domain-containing protein [Rhodospirillum centenum]ACI97691.1 rubisco activation protein CbbO, putative [Rhodospirillum centenum SW]
MSTDLEDIRRELVAAAPDLAGTLAVPLHEMSRLVSPAGRRDYLDGALALARLGRGSRLPAAYLAAMPQVARDCGEDAVADCRHAAMKLASMTSGEVLELVFASLPTAAARLGDADLLAAYMQVLHRLAARAPRGLRPMLGVLDELLSRLTLSGLRRWVEFGAESHRGDVAAQVAYFGLTSPESRSVLQRERRGTQFVDSQRRLGAFLRALWGRDFRLRPAASDQPGFRPFVDAGALHLPDAVDAAGGLGGLDVLRAMAAHMAAHLLYRRRPLPVDGSAPAARFLIGLVEDARVEREALIRFPGLRRLWAPLLAANLPPFPGHPGMDLVEAAARALLDPAQRTGDAALDALVDRFHAGAGLPGAEETLAITLGHDLHDLLSARRLLPSLRILESHRLAYRDDNHLLWTAEAFDDFGDPAGDGEAQGQVRRRVGLMEFINETDVENAGEDAQEIWVLGTELFPYEDDGISFNEREGRPPVSDPVRYPEWDDRGQHYRPDWVTLREHRPARGDPATIDAVLERHRGVTAQVRRIVDRLRPQGVERRRRLDDGDELDIGPAVDAMVMLRAGLQPDSRITRRSILHRRDLAVLVLLDLSASTNDPVRGSDTTILELTRDACTLLATAVSGIGDPFAIHGFASDGRQDVRYYRIKDFEQRFDGDARSRLAGLEGGLSTRLGTALRHAAHHLGRRPEAHRLLLVVTDGEPADVDERDPQHLRQDARRAVEELRAQGIRPFCLTLDPLADRYVARIFGINGYTVIDHVRRLPERLPGLFAALTR